MPAYPPAAAAAAGITRAALSPTSDTYIDSQGTTTNHEADTGILVGSDMSTSSFTRAALFEFDLSSFAGATILRARLNLTRTESGNGLDSTSPRILVVRKVLQAAVLTQTTWTAYATALNWASVGAHTLDTDVTTTEYGRHIAGYQRGKFWIDITDFVIDQAGTAAAQFILGLHAAAASGLNAATFASLENATEADRPVLEVLT